MEHWNVSTAKDGSSHLLNRCRTRVRVHKKLKLNLGRILSDLEEFDFPVAYTEGIKLINFSYLRIRKWHGMYASDVITIDARYGRNKIVETLIHEICHHVDSEEDASYVLKSERKRRKRSIENLLHSQGTEDDSEYLARGFERFYSGNPDDREMLRDRFPQLHRTLLRLHREFRGRG